MPWRSALAIAAAAAAFQLLLASRTALWDRDEPRFARAAAEMASSGNWLYPTFDGAVRAQKPPLVYWMMSSSIRAFGPSALAARTPSAAGVFVVVVATAFVSARLFGRAAGIAAGAIVASSPLVVAEGALATADSVLLACLTLALAGFTARGTGGGTMPSMAVYTVALAAAFLAKGPAALVVPAVALITALAARPRLPMRVSVEIVAGSAIAAAVFAVWFVAADRATAGAFTRQFIGHDVIARVVQPLEGHGGSGWAWLAFYPAVVVVGFAPWSPYVAPAARRLMAAPERRSLGALLVGASIAVPIAVFSGVATHLPEYVFSAWPALSLLVGAYIAASGAAASLAALAGSAALGMAASAMLIVVSSRFPDAGMRLPAYASALVALTGAASAFALQRRDRPPFVALVCGACAWLAVAGGWWLPRLDRLKPVNCLRRAMDGARFGADDVALFGFEEPSAVFYFDAPRRLASIPETTAWLAERRPGVLVTTAALAAALPPAPAVAVCRGPDLVHRGEIELIALARGGGPPR